MEFKGTKGKWIYDTTKNDIVNENVKGLLATAWSTYNSDIHEERLENESWLSMRKRTEPIRENCELEQKANALLISKAPELLEMLKRLIQPDLDISDLIEAENLIKEATEL